LEGVLWLVREVLPRLWRERPALRLVVFGASPTLEVLALAREDQRITVTGYVPGVEAERRALAEAQVVTVPLFSGGGTRLKVLNALASARPVVSTTLGASGFDLRDGEHLLLADNPAAFAGAVKCLLNDRSLAQGLAERGRAQVLALYSWERLLPALERIYAEVASGRSC
ncbi:MAG: glycosyltransferase family 4 protein, partial [Chloroflexi bacterium]|nr:glycosyltransferase family 4 protein [Chloroflexota bacterium]